MPQVTPKVGEQGSDVVATSPREERLDRTAVERFCALTRTERPTSQLIRFVAGPEDLIYPDLARRLPGRGVWITAERASVEKAVAAQAFARSLKRRVEVPQGLADDVETLLVRRTTQALALANKSGLVVSGFDKVNDALERSGLAALVHGSDAAPGGRDKLNRKFAAICRAAQRPAVALDCLTIDELSLAMGRPNVVHAGLKGGGSTERFIEEALRLTRYREGLGYDASLIPPSELSVMSKDHDADGPVEQAIDPAETPPGAATSAKADDGEAAS